MWSASEGTVEMALVVGLGSLKVVVRLLADDVQVAEESVLKEIGSVWAVMLFGWPWAGMLLLGLVADETSLS